MSQKIRCSIYTRKSSEEGLEQEFNSLDAQYEACKAYIASQKAEGWVLLKDRYDDGGLSGGTLERPALQKLLAAVDDRKVDQIIVYKIDRLTRSLPDFAKIVDRLDGADASFVSVTQSFNTATSMGRLTLNMLLSFAQFEREVTAERIRDKISASKQKGLWMGGSEPLGYRRQGRTLVIDQEETPIIRTLFDLYLETGKLITVRDRAAALDLRTRRRSHTDGSETGGRPFDRGHIHYILTNPIYAGRIRHGKKVYPGKHPPIINPAVWDEVQGRLQASAVKPRGRPGRPWPFALAGKLFDETGDRLTSTKTTKNGRRYFYYISCRLLKDKSQQHPDAWRLPAAQLEKAVREKIKLRLSDETWIPALIPDASIAEVTSFVVRMKHLRTANAALDGPTCLKQLIDRVKVAPGEIQIRISQEGIAESLNIRADRIAPDALTITAPFQLRRRGVEAKMVLGGEIPFNADPVLARNILKARAWFKRLKNGTTYEEIANLEKVSPQRVRMLIDMAFLSPKLIESIALGHQPLDLTTEWFRSHRLPALWEEQERLFKAV
ncbi:recombinase family protein [Limibacillus halophilus]